MKYDVQVRHVADSGDGISIEAEINGEPVAHTFPKSMGFLDKDKGQHDAAPKAVDKLVQIYKERYRPERNLTSEEAKAEKGTLENEQFVYFSDDRTGFKREENQEKSMSEKVDLGKPEDIRKYLKANLAEGYLSEEEGLNVDRFVDRYEELMSNEGGNQELVEKIFSNVVQ